MEGQSRRMGLGTLTDYVTAAVCLLGLVNVAQSKNFRRSSKSDVAFLTYGAFQMTASLCTAIAHTMIRSYLSEGAGPGLSWHSPNSSWLYAWLLAMCFASLAAAGFACLALSFTSLPYRSNLPLLHLPMVPGLIVCSIEAAGVIQERLESSGNVCLYFSLFANFGSVVAVLAEKFASPSDLLPLETARRWMLAGSVVLALSCVFAVLSPAECRSSSSQSCFLPVDTLQALLHLMLLAAVVLVTIAVRAKADAEQEYAYLEELKGFSTRGVVAETQRSCRSCTGWPFS